jgi:hypothetical protein
MLSGSIASFCGGVVAGKLCGTTKANTARWHGFVAWCVTTLVIFYLLTSAFRGIGGGSLSALRYIRASVNGTTRRPTQPGMTP